MLRERLTRDVYKADEYRHKDGRSARQTAAADVSGPIQANAKREDKRL